MADKDKYGIINLTELNRKLKLVDAWRKNINSSIDDSRCETTLDVLKQVKEECELLPSAEEVFDAGEARVFAKWEHEESAPMRDLKPEELPQTFDQFIENYKKP